MTNDERVQQNKGARLARAAVKRIIKELRLLQADAAPNSMYAMGFLDSLAMLTAKMDSGVIQAGKIKGGLGKR